MWWNRSIVTTLLLGICLSGAIGLGFADDAERDTTPPTEKQEDYFELMKVFADTFEQIERNYVKDVDRRVLVEAALRGMMEELDPYSNYISPDDLARFTAQVEQEFGGIGIQVGIDPKSHRLMVLTPLPGTPAYKAGIRSGDIIMEVNGKSTEGWTLEKAVKVLKGKEGEAVTLGVLHQGSRTTTAAKPAPKDTDKPADQDKPKDKSDQPGDAKPKDAQPDDAKPGDTKDKQQSKGKSAGDAGAAASDSKDASDNKDKGTEHAKAEAPVNPIEQITVVRAIIHVSTVLGDTYNPDDSWNYMLDDSRKIGYIRLTAFSRDSTRELREALKGLKKEGMKGLILDLRFNPGGLLTAATEISDLFLDEGKIVSTKGRNTQERVWEAKKDGTYSGFPMVVLVNRYSASASEIVSAALQDHERALVIGERSWGKGSVQNVIELEGGKSALKLTTASYHRPSGKNIHRFPGAKDTDEWGVHPDKGYELRLSNTELQNYLKYRQTRDVIRKDGPPVSDFADRQLAKAVEYLTDKINNPASTSDKAADTDDKKSADEKPAADTKDKDTKSDKPAAGSPTEKKTEDKPAEPKPEQSQLDFQPLPPAIRALLPAAA